MTDPDAPVPPEKLLTCPVCGWQWRSLACPMALGVHPLIHRCDNRKCARRWILLHRLDAIQPIRWKILAVEPLLGRHPAAIRRSLRAFPHLSEAEIELAAQAWSQYPEVAPPPKRRIDPAAVGRRRRKVGGR